MFGLRELLCIADAQHHIRVEPVLWIEGRRAPDRDRRVGLGDLAEVAPKLKIGVRMLSETVRADARQGDIGI